MFSTSQANSASFSQLGGNYMKYSTSKYQYQYQYNKTGIKQLANLLAAAADWGGGMSA